jgi:L-iditol 2-dehydrogenase
MKAVHLTNREEFRVVDIPAPIIRDSHDVLIKVKSVGVCGSDVHYFKNGGIGDQVITFPFIIGHEVAGIVDAVGNDVTRVKPGDLVAIEPSVSCYACDQCLAGRPHTCRNNLFLGCPGQLSGALAGFLVMPEHNCFPVPHPMGPDSAALCEPLTIGYYGVKQAGDVKDKVIGILGAGPIGLSVLLAAGARGAARVYMTDKLDYRCECATAHGAVWSGNPLKTDVVAEIKEREPLELDMVFECCGDQDAFDQGISLLKPGGTLALIGIPEFERYSFSVDSGRRKEIRIQHIRRQNGCTQEVIDAVVNKSIAADFMITHHFSPEEIDKAFHTAAGYKEHIIKGMIHFD